MLTVLAVNVNEVRETTFIRGDKGRADGVAVESAKRWVDRTEMTGVDIAINLLSVRRNVSRKVNENKPARVLRLVNDHRS